MTLHLHVIRNVKHHKASYDRYLLKMNVLQPLSFLLSPAYVLFMKLSSENGEHVFIYVAECETCDKGTS